MPTEKSAQTMAAKKELAPANWRKRRVRLSVSASCDPVLIDTRVSIVPWGAPEDT